MSVEAWQHADTFFRARYAYAVKLWQTTAFLSACFLLGFYFSVDFLGILVESWGDGDASQQ